MELGNKFWCGNCGREYNSVTGVINCKCKPQDKGKKWSDKQDDIVDFENERKKRINF